MTLSEALLEHAFDLAWSPDTDPLQKVKLRRAVSAAYYSIFHRITSDAVRLLAPNVLTSTNNRIQRWFNHAEMKTICGRFVPARLSGPLLELVGNSASADMQMVATNFIALQEARHKADYDLSYDLDWDACLSLVILAMDATAAWQRLQGSAEANIFILSLLMWKNWDKERP